MLDGLGDYCEAALAEHGCPSVSVAVAERGEVVLAEAYGLADVAAGRPATPDTAYGLASVTKPITAAAVCAAADDGLLDLDQPVPIDDRRRGPTVRQLLQHRGGLGAHYDFHYGGAEPSERARKPRLDADRYLTRYREPGTGFEYANLGYRLLGRALEAATGQPLADIVRERVFEPLGLTGCHLGAAYPGRGPAAVRYTVDGRAYPTYDSSHPGASLGWATAGELALFAQSYERLLSAETAAAVRNASPVTSHLGYGLGWCVSSGPGPTTQSHGGGMGGVAAMVVAVPDRRLSVAVLCNGTGKAARDRIVDHVLRALVPGHTAERISPAVDDPARPLRLPPSDWSGWVGTPDGRLPVAVRILPDGRAELRLADGGAIAPAVASAAWDLRLAVPVQLPTADAGLNSPLLSLDLRLGAGRLTGVARAYKDGDATGWLGNLLSHPCELRPC